MDIGVGRGGQGEAATLIWRCAGRGDGAEDLEKGNGRCLEEGKGRSQGEKAAGSPWVWSSPARGGQPVPGMGRVGVLRAALWGRLKGTLEHQELQPRVGMERVTCCSALGSHGGGEGRKEGGTEGRREEAGRMEGGRRKEGGRKEEGKKEEGRKKKGRMKGGRRKGRKV